jgi:glycosyltransferase involved in cell wall biosynthesis
MKLDIIVPQFNEGENYIRRLLDSVKRQRFVDLSTIRIVFVNGKSNYVPSSKIFDDYKDLNIKLLIDEENRGPGYSRQHGIDDSDAEYITFVDCDDELYGVDALYIVLSCINDTNPDIVFTASIREKTINGVMNYKKIVNSDMVASLHGKFIKREFLLKRNIRFHEKIWDYEDSYFNTILYNEILETKANEIHLDFVTYLWKENNDSVTLRKRKYEYHVDTFDKLLECPILTYDELDKRNSKYKDEYIKNALLLCFVYLESNLFSAEELKEKKKKFEEILYEYFSKYGLLKLDLKVINEEIDNCLNFKVPKYGFKLLNSFENFINSHKK